MSERHVDWDECDAMEDRNALEGYQRKLDVLAAALLEHGCRGGYCGLCRGPSKGGQLRYCEPERHEPLCPYRVAMERAGHESAAVKGGEHE